jgi:hypothetical protein
MEHSLGKIKALQKAGILFTIVECGNAATISNYLLSIPLASKMIRECYQPYSKEAQEKLFGATKRSVSQEFVVKVANKIKGPVLVTSFQLQGEDPAMLTHGWIAIKVKDEVHSYHISIYRNEAADEEHNLEEQIEARERYLEDIRNAAINIMYKHTIDETHSLKNLWIDGIFNSSSHFRLSDTIKLLGECDEIDTMVPRPQAHVSWVRMEDIVRDAKGLIIMRGSFNPLHHGHIKIMETVRKKYPDYTPIFLISIHNRDKAPLNELEASFRGCDIQTAGYEVVYTSLPFFNDSSSMIFRRWPNLPVVYPVGMDTINRFINDEVKRDKEAFEGLYECIEGFQLNSKSKPIERKEWTEAHMDKSVWHFFYGARWAKHKFVVVERGGEALSPYAKYFSNIIELDSSYKDDGISSTKIRKGEAVNELYEKISH